MRQVIWLDFGIILGIGRPQADFSTRFGPQQYWIQGIAFTECISHKVFIKDLQQGVVCVFCIVMMKGSAAHFLGHVEKYLSTDTKKILVNRSPVESWVRCNECNLQVGPTVVPPLGGDKCVAFHANRSRQRTYVQSKRHLTKVEKGL